MKAQTLKIKPLSINEAFEGRRFKTSKHETYEKEVIWSLKPITLPEPPFHITYIFGLSNVSADVDNVVKIFQDCLQKKYRFNDSLIHKFSAEKIKVKKGEEYISFAIESYLK